MRARLTLKAICDYMFVYVGDFMTSFIHVAISFGCYNLEKRKQNLVFILSVSQSSNVATVAGNSLREPISIAWIVNQLQ